MINCLSLREPEGKEFIRVSKTRIATRKTSVCLETHRKIITLSTIEGDASYRLQTHFTIIIAFINDKQDFGML